jgi:general secretion pathway protein N
MKRGRYFLLLMGIALLGAVASFNQMTPDVQAALLDAADQMAAGRWSSLQPSTVATHRAVTEVTDPSALERPARVLGPPPAEGREGAEAPSQLTGPRSHAEPRTLAGNPLWALSLEQLSITRERPIFSPSRRPPPAPPIFVATARIRPAIKQPEPERPAVSLIGTVISTQVRIGVFLETATQNVFRLRLGEDRQGWVLRLVKPREVTLVKDIEQTLVLDSPPGEAAALRGPSVSPPVPNSIGTIPVLNTANYVDEQPLPARGARGQRR